jgi:hypothetical protein
MIVVQAFVLLAIVAWLVAAAAAVNLMKYRLPGREPGWYAVRGIAFFSAENFTPEGRRTQRVFLLASAAFTGAIVGAIVYGIAAS